MTAPDRPGRGAGVPAWVRDAVFYQIFPDRFARSTRVPKPGPLEAWDASPTPHGFKGGDLLGIVERLGELAELGITALYLTPIFSSASNHRYHTYDYLEVDPLLGGTAALRELVDAVHARGMRIVLDGVFNHTGRGFWPFHHVAENGLDSPYADWFLLDRERLAAGHGLQPYPSRVTPWSEVVADPEEHRLGLRSVRTLGYRAWWDLPALPKLNTDHPPVREFLWSVAEHWLRFGIDGWRLDVPAEIDDEGFWQEFRRRCLAVNPDAYLVGEIWQVAPEWVGGDRFDALTNYPLLEAILSFVAGPSLDAALLAGHHELSRHVDPTDAPGFAERLGGILSAYAPATVAVQLNLLSSHDMPRFRSLVGGDAAAFRLAALLQMTLPGAPSVYYGDEVGMEGGHDPDCRRAFPAGPAGRDDAIRATLRALVAARREHRALRSDRVVVVAASGSALVFLRGGEDDPTAGGETLLVALNAGTEAAEFTLAGLADLVGRGDATLGPVEIPGLAAPLDAGVAGDGSFRLRLVPRSGGILRSRSAG